MPAHRVFDIEDYDIKNKAIVHQKRVVGLIGFCRLSFEISPGSWHQADALKSLVDKVDDAVKRAVEADKDMGVVPKINVLQAFYLVRGELARYIERYHPEKRAVLVGNPDINRLVDRLDGDDTKSESSLRKRGKKSSAVKRVDISHGHSSQVRVRFQILISPTGRSKSHILICELGTEVKISEVLWIFARLPGNLRLMLKDIPHFYLSKDLPDRPLAYTEEFRLEPLNDLRPEKDLLVLVLVNRRRTGRIFFECGNFNKAYTNIWKPHNTVILKDFQGIIEPASRIGPMIQGEVCIWKRGRTHPLLLELTEWTDALDQALQYPDVDWLIRTETSPSEAIAIEVTWERCTPVPHVPFQGIAPLSQHPLEPTSPASQTMPVSSSNSAVASNVVHTQSRTRTRTRPKDTGILERQRPVVLPVSPPASVGSSRSQSRWDLLDVADVPSSSNSAVASNVVHTQSRTRTRTRPKDTSILERQRPVVLPVSPPASVGSSQSRWDLLDVADVPYTEATGSSVTVFSRPSGARLSVMQPDRVTPPPSRPSKVTDSPGLDLENPHTSVPTSSRRPFGVTRPRFSTAPPLVKITYSPLERLALSIEDLIASTDGASTPDANETLTSWPKLEGCLIQADIATDPLAVLAAAARDSGRRTSS